MQLFKVFRGIRQYCDGSIKIPSTEEINGILNFFLYIHVLVDCKIPFCIIHYGTVLEIIG